MSSERPIAASKCAVLGRQIQTYPVSFPICGFSPVGICLAGISSIIVWYQGSIYLTNKYLDIFTYERPLLL